MPQSLPIRAGLAIPLEEVELRTSRSSGPGGQHANVTASRVEAVFDVARLGDAVSDAQKARIGGAARAARDRRRAGHALPARATASSRSSGLPSGSQARSKVARPRTTTRPTRASQKRRVEGKRRRGETKRARRRPDLD